MTRVCCGLQLPPGGECARCGRHLGQSARLKPLRVVLLRFLLDLVWGVS